VLNCQGLKGRFPLRAADGSMTMDRLLTVPESEEGDSGSRTRLPLHPTCGLAGRFAPCLECSCSRGWPIGPELAGLGNGSLLRRAFELAPSSTSRWLRALPDRADRHGIGFCLCGAADARHCAELSGAFEALGMHCELNARPNVRAKLPA
jgi:hypothetical protein